MNNFVVMAEITQEPQLRYTSDNQLPVTEMMVQFPALRDSDPPSVIKVTGWGNLAQEIQEQFHVGDRVILEGRLTMLTVERPEGFKEKRAEMTAQRIHRVEADGNVTTRTSDPGATPARPAPSPTPSPAAAAAQPAATPTSDPVDYDDIPF